MIRFPSRYSHKRTCAHFCLRAVRASCPKIYYPDPIICERSKIGHFLLWQKCYSILHKITCKIYIFGPLVAMQEFLRSKAILIRGENRHVVINISFRYKIYNTEDSGVMLPESCRYSGSELPEYCHNYYHNYGDIRGPRFLKLT